jgi:hypothetical protein
VTRMVPPDALPAVPSLDEDNIGDVVMVNKITWQRAGGVTEPGRYMFTFGWLTVTPDDLAIWKQYPDAAFTLVELPHGSNEASDEAEIRGEEFHLGTFELPRPADHEQLQ